jgi:hypothetical protein
MSDKQTNDASRTRKLICCVRFFNELKYSYTYVLLPVQSSGVRAAVLV